MYKVSVGAVDFDQNKQDVVPEQYAINKAIVLPRQVYRDDSMAAIFNSISPSIDRSKTRIIIDKSDLPAGVSLEPDDYFKIDGKRNNIEKVENLDLNLGAVVTVTEVEGEPL